MKYLTSTNSNLFAPNFPARPNAFVGREIEINRFKRIMEEGITSERTNSIALLGEWGAGKSSLLIKYYDILEKNYKESIPILFSVTGDIVNYEIFAQALLDKFHRNLLNKKNLKEKIKEEIKNWRVQRIGVSSFLSIERKEEKYFLTSGNSLLRHNFEESWNKFFKPGGIKQVIFLLDDLHNMDKTSNGTVLALRDLFQLLPVEGYNYSVIFTAKTDYFSGVRQLAEPAVRFYEKFYLEYFSLEETINFIRKTIELSNLNMEVEETVIEHMYKLTLGHPYFLSFIGKYLVELSKEKIITQEYFEKLWPEIFNHLEREKFNDDIARVRGKELKLLLDMAGVDKEHVQVSELRKKYATIYITRLKEKNLIKRMDRGEYRIYHPLFKEFLRKLD